MEFDFSTFDLSASNMLVGERILRVAAETLDAEAIVDPDDDLSTWWQPFPGSPQEQAEKCEADELFFGGSAGGGKSFLILGLAITKHSKSIIFRREYPQLKELEEQFRSLISGKGRYNQNDRTGRLKNGKVIEFAAVQHEWDVEKYQGRQHDFVAFDEITHFSRQQYKFLIGWNRSGDPKQRCRVVVTGNPPTTAEGRWVIEEWAPWLDDTFPNPAKPGELRWYTTINGRMKWLDGPEPIQVGSETVIPMSRTFIPASLSDNPVLSATNYGARLQAMPEPLRSIFLTGNFKASIKDDPWQVIPIAHVQAAMKRWTEKPPQTKQFVRDRGTLMVDLPMTSLGADIARGGSAKTVVAKRRHNWFDILKKVPGKDTPDGPTAALAIAVEHEGTAEIFVDVIGVGASAYDSLKDLPGLAGLVIPVNNSERTKLLDRSGKFRLVNIRSASYWALREALDPIHGADIALPPDPELLADLCAPRFKVTSAGILIEEKEEIIARLGRSPDCGDAVVLTFAPVQKGLRNVQTVINGFQSTSGIQNYKGPLQW